MQTYKFKIKLKKTRKNMEKIYQNRSGYMSNLSKYNEYHTTYGEVTQEGIEKLINAFSSQPITTYDNKRRTFYDLGSGIGKNVIVVASLVPEIKSKGVEIVQERHDMALDALKQIRTKNVKDRIEFICGSFMDINLEDAAWIYLSNLCFTQDLNKQMSVKLNKEIGINTMIACSAELELPDCYSIEKLNIPMSWNKHSMIYLYKKLV